MSEPTTLHKDGESRTVYAPSQVRALLADDWTLGAAQPGVIPQPPPENKSQPELKPQPQPRRTRKPATKRAGAK